MEQLNKTTSISCDGAKIYETLKKKKMIIFAGLLFFCAIFLILDIVTGAAMLPVSEVLACLFRPAQAANTTRVIIWSMRLPIALMALVIGCSLGTAGSVMQTILHNPLASPYTLGIGSGASFGASLAIIMGWGEVGVSVMAFLFAMLICMFVNFMGRSRLLSSNSMVLSGIAMLFLFQALQALLQYDASEAQNQSIIFWSFGSLQKTTWSKLGITALITTICIPLILRNSWQYTALIMGDEKAESLGVPVNQLKLHSFFLISLLAAASVCFTGSIGFIGLAGPHIARLLVGDDQRFYILLSGVCGAAILSAASILSKLIHPGIIFPIGIITSIIGVPFFFALVFHTKGSDG